MTDRRIASSSILLLPHVTRQSSFSTSRPDQRRALSRAHRAMSPTDFVGMAGEGAGAATHGAGFPRLILGSFLVLIDTWRGRDAHLESGRNAPNFSPVCTVGAFGTPLIDDQDRTAPRKLSDGPVASLSSSRPIQSYRAARRRRPGGCDGACLVLLKLTFRRPFWGRPFFISAGVTGDGEKTNGDGGAARLALVRDAASPSDAPPGGSARGTASRLRHLWGPVSDLERHLPSEWCVRCLIRSISKPMAICRERPQHRARSHLLVRQRRASAQRLPARSVFAPRPAFPRIGAPRLSVRHRARPLALSDPPRPQACPAAKSESPSMKATRAASGLAMANFHCVCILGNRSAISTGRRTIWRSRSGQAALASGGVLVMDLMDGEWSGLISSRAPGSGRSEHFAVPRARPAEDGDR